MIRLLVQAPFAACRTFTAGWYRPTASFLTHSAAYGLLLNIARIESRLREEEQAHDGRISASLTRTGLPVCRVALGLPEGRELPQVRSVFQQLHNYPVGRDAGMPLEMAKGNKNNITPVRRELLLKLHAVIAVEENENDGFEDRIMQGLRGELNTNRYGLPFLGDNSFLVDRIDVAAGNAPARWYERVSSAESNAQPDTTRLTARVDRADMSRTTSGLFAPAANANANVPETAWVRVGG